MDLLAARTDLHLVAKTESTLFQFGDSRSEIGHLKNHAIPSTGFLMIPTWHGARARGSRATENQLKTADGKLGEGR